MPEDGRIVTESDLAGYAPANHGHAELPTPGQKNALAGTQGTPGVNNPYVTDQGLAAALGALPPSGGGWATAKLGVDRAQSTVNLADVTGLELALAANKDYEFEFLLGFLTAAATTGLVLALNGPAMSFLWAKLEVPVSNSASVVRFANGYAQEAIGTASTVNSQYLATARGVLHTTAAGVLVPRYRSEVAASLVTVKAGSFGRVREVV